MNTTVRTNLNGKICHFSVSKQEIASKQLFELVVRNVRALYPTASAKGLFKFSFEDDENDVCQIDSESEMRECFNLFAGETVNLMVSVAFHDVAQSSSSLPVLVAPTIQLDGKPAVLTVDDSGSSGSDDSDEDVADMKKSDGEDTDSFQVELLKFVAEPAFQEIGAKLVAAIAQGHSAQEIFENVICVNSTLANHDFVLRYRDQLPRFFPRLNGLLAGAKAVLLSFVLKLPSVVVNAPRVLNYFRPPVKNDKATHIGVLCSACKCQPIVGVRYKCMTCVNVNLCEKCEVSHPPAHRLIKFKESAILTNPPLMPIRHLMRNLIREFFNLPKDDTAACKDVRQNWQAWRAKKRQWADGCDWKTKKKAQACHWGKGNWQAFAAKKRQFADGWADKEFGCADEWGDKEFDWEAKKQFMKNLWRSQKNPWKWADKDIDWKVKKQAMKNLWRSQKNAWKIHNSQQPVQGPVALHSTFLQDSVKPENDSPVEAGAVVVKTWSMSNSGTQPWHASSLLFVGGDLDVAEIFPVKGDVSPGDWVKVGVKVRISDKPSESHGYFRLQDANNQRFGHRMRVSVVIESDDTVKVKVSQPVKKDSKKAAKKAIKQYEKSLKQAQKAKKRADKEAVKEVKQGQKKQAKSLRALFVSQVASDETPTATSCVVKFRMLNPGPPEWPSNSELLYVKGDLSEGQVDISPLKAAEPTKETVATVAMALPPVQSGVTRVFTTYFRMAYRTDLALKGLRFGQRVWVRATVDGNGQVTVVAMLSSKKDHDEWLQANRAKKAAEREAKKKPKGRSKRPKRRPSELQSRPTESPSKLLDRQKGKSSKLPKWQKGKRSKLLNRPTSKLPNWQQNRQKSKPTRPPNQPKRSLQK
jgi:hypothetical protein